MEETKKQKDKSKNLETRTRMTLQPHSMVMTNEKSKTIDPRARMTLQVDFNKGDVKIPQFEKPKGYFNKK